MNLWFESLPFGECVYRIYMHFLAVSDSFMFLT